MELNGTTFDLKQKFKNLENKTDNYFKDISKMFDDIQIESVLNKSNKCCMYI
jgi:hypothetical protein